MDFTSHDGAEHRTKRLKRAATIFCEIAGITYEHAQGLICVLHDNHGKLEVHWRYGTPSNRQREAFSSTWKLVGEHPDAVKHFPAE